jgi:PST family polysaccharide transporter
MDHAVKGTSVSTRKSLFFVYGSYLLRYVQLLILVPFYGRVLGAAEYGKVLAAMSLFQVVWMIVEHGFPTVGARDLASTRDKAVIAREFGRQFMARLLLSVLGIVIGVGGTAFSPILRADPALGLVATALGIISAFNLSWYFQGMLRFRTSVMLEVAGFAINLVLILSVVRDAGDGLLVLMSLLVSGLACTVAAHVIALRQIDIRSIRFFGAISLVRTSGNLFAYRGLSMIVASASTYLLSLFASPAEVGYYGSAERLANVALSLMQPANQVLIGTVTWRLGSCETEAAAYALMRKGLAAMGAFGIVACFGAITLSPYLIPIIFGPGFDGSIPIMQLHGLMFPFAALGQVICMYVLIPLREDKRVMKITASGAACSLIVMLLLVRDFSGLGVAGARVVGAVVTTILLAMAMGRGALYRRIFQS